MLEQTEIARIAGAVNHLRPDWPNASIYTFIARELSARAYRDVAVAMAWIAADPKSDTPRRVLEAGPWWKVATVDKPAIRHPHGAEECSLHPGQWDENCHSCRADKLTGDRTTEGEPRRPDRSPQMAELRRIHAEAKAGLCRHGVIPERCADHKPDAVKAEPA